MRTKDPLICECGHEGVLHCSENDQPYSKMWESYRVEGFDGGGGSSPNVNEMRCPACGSVGKVRFQ